MFRDVPGFVPFASILMLLALPVGAQADTSSVAYLQQVRTGYAIQIGNGDLLQGQGYDLLMNASVIPGHGFETLAWITPAGEHIDLTLDTEVGLGFYYASPRFATVGEMDQRFGAGEYVHDFVGPAATAESSMTASLGPYPAGLPYLAGTTYSDLQGMDASQPFDFRLGPLTAGDSGVEMAITFFVDDVLTGTTMFATGGSVVPGLDHLTMPANLLQGGRTYEYQFYLGHRIEPPVSGALGGSQGFRYLTTGTFTTAVPEPGSAWLVLGGIGVLTGLGFRRSRAG